MSMEIEILVVSMIIQFVVGLFLGWRLLSKAGYPGLCVLLFLVPILGVLLVLYLVFAEWPIERSLRLYIEKYGLMKEPTPEDDVSEDAPCVQCGAIMTAGNMACARCGWTYRHEVAAPDGVSQPLQMKPVDEPFGDYREF